MRSQGRTTVANPSKVRLTAHFTTAEIQLSCSVCGESQAAGTEFLGVGPTMAREADECYVVCLPCAGKIPPFSLAAHTLRERALVGR